MNKLYILIFMSHWKKKIPVHVSYNLTNWETCCWYTHRHTHFPMRRFPGGPTWFQTYRQTDRHCHPIYQNKTYHYNRNSSSWDHHDRKTSIHLLKAIKTCTCYNNILIVLILNFIAVLGDVVVCTWLPDKSRFHLDHSQHKACCLWRPRPDSRCCYICLRLQWATTLASVNRHHSCLEKSKRFRFWR